MLWRYCLHLANSPSWCGGEADEPGVSADRQAPVEAAHAGHDRPDGPDQPGEAERPRNDQEHQPDPESNRTQADDYRVQGADHQERQHPVPEDPDLPVEMRPHDPDRSAAPDVGQNDRGDRGDAGEETKDVEDVVEARDVASGGADGSEDLIGGSVIRT